VLGVATESGGLAVRECRDVYDEVDMLVMINAQVIGSERDARPGVRCRVSFASEVRG